MRQEINLDEMAGVVGGVSTTTTSEQSAEDALRNAWNELGFAAKGYTEHMFEAYLDEFTFSMLPPSEAMNFLQGKMV